ncbi:hypothetical protein [Rhodococcus marinonascens]|uniref:hypothetical protein n=1 Tax=Rhodococcus marinonascens TaxID=38311 RepID=UPI00093254E3|nr:hypothetical protein [Rhodococcus marinonascens]
MDGNTFAITMLMMFNALSMLGALYCGHRSYRRHGRPGRAVFAAAAGLFIAPMLLMLCVGLARPRR